MKLDFKEDERDVLIYAFRYALGRRTFASKTMSEVIIANWDKLSEFDKGLFKKEIREHEKLYGNLGDDCDRSSWYRILEL